MSPVVRDLEGCYQSPTLKTRGRGMSGPALVVEQRSATAALRPVCTVFAWAKNARMFPTDLIWAQGSIGMGHLRPCPVGQQQEQADLSRGEAGMDLDSKGLRREGMSAGIVLSRRHLHGGNWDRGVWKNPNRSPPERLNFTHCRECDTSSQQCRPSRNFPAPILSLSPAPERRGCSPE